MLFFFNDTATTEIYTLSLHDALPISVGVGVPARRFEVDDRERDVLPRGTRLKLVAQPFDVLNRVCDEVRNAGIVAPRWKAPTHIGSSPHARKMHCMAAPAQVV